jgi:SNF2 family DNA or RNA helicase
VLYQHQKNLIEKNPAKHLIAFDVGCGKTLTSIELAKKASSILVVTTKSLTENWLREFKQWAPDYKGYYKIVSKERFKKDWNLLAKYECIIIDEVHFFAYYTNGFHKALLKYIKKHDPKYIYGLTATPILSNVISVLGLARLLGHPISFNWFQNKFYYKVKMGFKWVPIQKKDIENDIADLIRQFGTVVSKEEALDLPDTVHLFEYFELTDEQLKAIEDLDLMPNTQLPIVYNTKCLQICGGSVDNKRIKTEKTARLLELIEQYKNCVVVAKHTAELEMLHEIIPNSVILDGSVPGEKRQEIIDICNKGDKIMLLQADTGTGFNLTGVSLMIFFSHTYNFVTYAQCLGRIHRIGQTNKCTYIHFINNGTIDEAVWECLGRKEDFDIALYKRNESNNTKI